MDEYCAMLRTDAPLEILEPLQTVLSPNKSLRSFRVGTTINSFNATERTAHKQEFFEHMLVEGSHGAQ